MGLPSKFGRPARVGVTQNQNKIEINVISVDTNNTYQGEINSVIMNNIATYLSEFRSINDYVLVKPGEVIDLSFEISVLVDPTSQLSTITQVIQVVSNEFKSSNRHMGSGYYIFGLIKLISNITGVLNINYIKVFNKTGVGYSQNTINQTIIDSNTNEIDLSSGYINCDANQILQIKDINNDIVVIPVVANNIKSLI